MPPLSSSRTGPPQRARSAGLAAHYPETATCGPRKEDTAGRSHRPVGRRLPAAAYPRKSDVNPSQGPIIYRPHPHPKHAGLWGFLAPSRPPPGGRTAERKATAWAGTHLSAFGQREAAVQARNRTGRHASGREVGRGRRPDVCPSWSANPPGRGGGTLDGQGPGQRLRVLFASPGGECIRGRTSHCPEAGGQQGWAGRGVPPGSSPASSRAVG